MTDVEFTPWVNQVSGFSASAMNAPLDEIKESANLALGEKAESSHTHSESEITDLGTHNHNSSYYTKTELNTSGGVGEVHWNRVTNKPTSGAGSGDVIGPSTNTDNYVPQWSGANTKTLKNGLLVVSSIADPGSSTKLVSERAVRLLFNSIPDLPEQVYIVAGSYGTEEDLVPDTKIIFRHKFTDTIEFPIDFDGSNFWAETAATAQTIFSITKNGSSIGTATFDIGETVAYFYLLGGEVFEANSILRIVSPTQDTTLSGISWALRAVRSVSSTTTTV